MAQWKETLEPYVKVIESVKTTALNPTAGGDLILGAVIISDSGPSQPTLITSQSEFLEVFSAEEVTKDYVKSLDSLYVSDEGSSLASTMWLNAYRLAGSANLLVCRASRANGIIYTKPFEDTVDDFIIKDSEVLKRVPTFKFVIDTASPNGQWAIAINEVGIFGNLIDDNGPRYDYYVNNLFDLTEKLNETNKFYSPDYEFYEDEKCTKVASNPERAVAVLYNEVYLGPTLLDVTALTDETTVDEVTNFSTGLAYLFAAEKEYTWNETEGVDNPQNLYNLNDAVFSGFTPFKYYASNLFNTRSELSVRIRRFNHNSVTVKTTTNPNESPWTVDLGALKFYVAEQEKGNMSSLHYDFYEFCVLDPSISEEPTVFNVGNLPGRGDITVDELKASLGMIYLSLPENLYDLGLNYYDYSDDNSEWYVVETWRAADGPMITVGEDGKEYLHDSTGDKCEILLHKDALPKDATLGTKYAVGVSDVYDIYQFQINSTHPHPEFKVDLSLNNSDTKILSVSDADILRAWDKIEDDERYVVEGFTDLGCTYTNIQNYIANIAINSNYFYAFSSTNTTNYMTIASKASKMAKKSHKLYVASPWDYDDGTVGFQFAVSPSVMYWEAVLRNRQNNNEFAGVFGQNTGRVSIMNLAKEFNKSERQLLLSKKVNTICYDNYLGSYYFNDNYTFTEESHVMAEECNSRLQIRISKAMPLLLNQFKGRQNTPKVWKEIRETIKFWFISTIMTYNYTIAEYRIICDESNNKEETIRQNKVFITIQVRFNSSIKFITVYNDAYPIGVEFAE